MLILKKMSMNVSLFAVAIMIVLGCATPDAGHSAPPVVPPPARHPAPPPVPPPAPPDPAFLMGRWHGTMSVPHPPPHFDPRVELIITDPSFNGRLTRFLVNGPPQDLHLSGHIENGFLVFRWADGNWMSLNLRGARQSLVLNGTHSFSRGGTISLKKMP